MHLVVFTVQRLVATLTAAEPAALVSMQRDIKCNAVKKHLSCQSHTIPHLSSNEKHLSCHTQYPVYYNNTILQTNVSSNEKKTNCIT